MNLQEAKQNLKEKGYCSFHLSEFENIDFNKFYKFRITEGFEKYMKAVRGDIFGTSHNTYEVDDYFDGNNFVKDCKDFEEATEYKTHFLNKYKNSSQFKGNIAEIELQHMLLSIMPSDEIIRVSNDTATCDLKVNRKDHSKPNILFESKNYTNKSVTTAEVKKFERDVQLQKSHGIFISQESPITFKDNYQIDIINGLIHVYIPNANYDVEKIKIAIDIVDNLSFKLNSLLKDTDDDYSISKEDIDEISDEYKNFGLQKSLMLDTIKLVNKQLIDKLEEIQLPKVKKFLMKLGNIENDNDFKCTICNNWSGRNKASLGAHIRNCKQIY